MFAAAAGASVGAGSGRSNTPAASAAATEAESTAAPRRRMASGRSASTGASIPIQTRTSNAAGQQSVQVGNTFYPAHSSVTAGLQVVTLSRSQPTNSALVKNATYDLAFSGGVSALTRALPGLSTDTIVVISSLASPGATAQLSALQTEIAQGQFPRLGQTFAPANLTTSSTYSLIGVPGFAPGVGAELSSVVRPGSNAKISGALTQSSDANAPLTGDFTFVYQDAVTYTSTPLSNPLRNQLVVNGTVYTTHVTSDHLGGFSSLCSTATRWPRSSPKWSPPTSRPKRGCGRR